MTPIQDFINFEDNGLSTGFCDFSNDFYQENQKNVSLIYQRECSRLQEINIENQKQNSILRQRQIQQQIFDSNPPTNPPAPEKSKPIDQKTKNFLQVFRRVFLKEIKKNQKQILGDQKIVPIVRKGHITLQDYNTLLTDPTLKLIWTQMFAKKVLYRHLMTARAKRNQKYWYWLRIGVFEKGFQNQLFDRIN